MQKKMTHKQLRDFLLLSQGTQIIGIVTETSGKNSFNLSKFGNRVDKMTADPALNCRPENIVKFSHKTVFITPLDFKGLIENRNEKDVKEVLTALQLSTDDVEKQLAYAEALKVQADKEYDVSKRKNGTTISGMLVESAKDEHPMITVYNNARNRPLTDFYKDEVLLDKEVVKPYKKPYDFAKKYKKQLDFGIINPIDTQNYRFENIRRINMGGEQVEIIPD